MERNKIDSQTLLDLAGVMFITIDTNGIVTLVNRKTCEVFGYNEDEMLGKNWFENFLPKHIRDEVLPIADKLLSGEIETAEYYENPILSKNGQEKLISWHNAPIKDSSGNIIGHLSSGEDITEKKRVENELVSQHNKLNTILNSFYDGIYQCSSDYEIQYLNPAMINNIGFDATGEKCYKVIYNKDEPCSWCYFSKLKKENKKNIIEVELNNKYYQVSAVLLENNSKLTVYNDITERKKAEIDLLTKNHELTSAEEEIRAANEELIATSNSLEENNRELLVAKENAEESEDQFRSLFDYSPISLWEEDFSEVKQLLDKKNNEVKDLKKYLNDNPDFVSECASKIKISHVNRITLKLFGIKNKNELVKNLNKTFNNKSFETFKEELVAISNGIKNFTRETEFVRTDGKIITTIIQFVVVNNYEKVIVSIADITKQKNIENKLLKAKEYLEQSEEKLNEAQSIAKLGHYVFNVIDGTWTSSLQLDKIFGIDDTFIRDVNGWAQIMHPDFKDDMANYLQNNVLTQHNKFNKIYQIINQQNGKTRWVHGLGDLKIDKDGNPYGMFGTIQDVTEQKEAEKQIVKLSTAIEQSANTVVITNIDGNIEYTNPKFTEISGYTAKEALGQNPRILNAGTQPKKYYKELWETITKGKTWKGEFCNRTKKGKLFWENVTITPLKDDKGEIVNYLAIKEDITERKIIEDELFESEEKINLLLNSTSDIAVLLNPKGTIITCNENFAVLMHKSSDELIGKLFFSFFPKTVAERRELVFKSFLQKKKYLRFEDMHNNKYYENTLRPIFDDKKNIKLISVFTRDITLRVNNQKEVLNATIQGEEKERLRIARDIHDGVSPMLSALKIYIQSLDKFKEKDIIDELHQKLNYTIDETIDGLSEISNNLSPHVLQNFGLEEAIRHFTEKSITLKDIKIECNCKLGGRLNTIVETTIYRITTELINNTIKYSKASAITIKIVKNKAVNYYYSDNGTGFNYKDIDNKSKGMGLRNIVTRIESINGVVDIDSNNGFKININLPLID